MPATVETAATPSTPDLQRIKETAKLLFFQGFNYDVISAETGIAKPRLRMWAFRGNWKKGVSQVKQIAVKNGMREVTKETTGQLADASTALRETFSRTLATTGGLLDQIAQKPRKGTLAHIERLGAALEPLVRSAKIVHDWGSGSIQGVILAGELTLDRDPHYKPSGLNQQRSPNELNPGTPADTVNPSALNPIDVESTTTGSVPPRQGE